MDENVQINITEARRDNFTRQEYKYLAALKAVQDLADKGYTVRDISLKLGYDESSVRKLLDK